MRALWCQGPVRYSDPIQTRNRQHHDVASPFSPSQKKSNPFSNNAGALPVPLCSCGQTIQDDGIEMLLHESSPLSLFFAVMGSFDQV